MRHRGETLHRILHDTLRKTVRHAGPAALLAFAGFVTGTSAEAQRDLATERSAASTRNAESLLARRVTVDLVGVSRVEALKAVAANAKVVVQYRVRTLEAYRDRVTVRARDISLRDALNRVFEGTPLAVVVDEMGRLGVVDAREETSAVVQATGTISGEVIDSATGRGVARATITVAGTELTTLAGTDGRFSIAKVPAGEHSVTVKLIGYRQTTQSATVPEGGVARLRVVLRPTTHVLSGVVTTATGTQRRLDIGNSIVSLNVDSIMQVAPIMTVTDLIEGRVPGVTVQRTSGTPGDPARIRMRGSNSINQNSDPIIIVDGIRMYSRQSDARNVNTGGVTGVVARTYASPAAIDLIDPNTIERVDIMRGPSAASMYGSEAANGVIVITTKKGRAGPTTTDLTLIAGTTHMPGKWPVVPYHFGTALHGGPPILCVSFCGDAGIDSVVRFQALNDSRLTALGRGSISNGSATVSGGTSQTTYNFTASTTDEVGILKLPAIEEERYLRFQGKPAPDWMRRPDRFQKQSFLGKMQATLSRDVTLTASTQLSTGIQRRSSMSTSAGSAISILQRTYVDLSQLAENPILGNPYERVVTDATKIQNDVQLIVRRWTWLPLDIQVGKDALREDVEMSIARGLTTGVDSTGAIRSRTKTATTTTARVRTEVPLYRFVQLSVGMEFIRGRTADQEGSFRGIAEGVTDPATGLETTATTFSKATSENPSFGVFLVPRLNLPQRFNCQPGFRLDNNGLSGKNAGLNLLPKMDCSWVTVNTNDGDAPLFGMVSLLRPRLAFGVAGVTPNAGDQLRLFQQEDGNLVGGAVPQYGTILTLKTLGNTSLKPERKTELEGGFEAAFANGRVNLSITGSRSYRKDAIVDNNFATSVYGGGRTKMNVGDIRNTGLEVDLGATLLERRAISLSFQSNFSRYRSKVMRLSADGAAVFFSENGQILTDVNSNSVNGSRYVVGYPVEGIWDYPILGYQDVDGNGWIRPDEVVVGTSPIYIGSTEPKYQALLSPTMSLFGRITLAAQLNYTGGFMQSVTEGGGLLRLRDGGLSPVYGSIVQGPDGFDRQIAVLGNISRLLVPTGGQVLTGMRQEIDMLRLQSMSVGFNLGIRGARLFRARAATLALQGSNLGLWTRYVGVDPNVNGVLGGHGLQDTGGQPEPRSWQVRLQLRY